MLSAGSPTSPRREPAINAVATSAARGARRRRDVDDAIFLSALLSPTLTAPLERGER